MVKNKTFAPLFRFQKVLQSEFQSPASIFVKITDLLFFITYHEVWELLSLNSIAVDSLKPSKIY